MLGSSEEILAAVIFTEESLQPLCCCVCASERGAATSLLKDFLYSVTLPLAAAGESMFIRGMAMSRYVLSRKEKGGDKEGNH